MTKRPFSSKATLIACLVVVALSLFTAPITSWAAGGVIVNGVTIPPEKVHTLEQRYRVRIVDGDYWYDRISGAWGYRGGPCMGQIHPFMKLGGPLRANASNGNTRVFINGRELHPLDVRALQQITVVIPGRYWCDAGGISGSRAGLPSPTCGIYQMRPTLVG